MKIDFPADDLARIVQSSAYLEELDISENHMLPVHFAPLLRALAFDKEMRILNLSNNLLLAKQDCVRPYDFSKLPLPLRQTDNKSSLISLASLSDLQPEQMPLFVV